MKFKHHIMELMLRTINWYILNRVVGLENIPKRGTGFVAAANHLSFADGVILPQILASARNECPHMASYAYLFEKPFLGFILRAAEGLAVDPKTQESIEAFMNEAKKILVEKNECVGIHPEAHIQRDKTSLGKGRVGSAILALETGCSVVPFGLIGTDRVLPPGGRLSYRRRAVWVNVGRPMNFDKYTEQYLNGSKKDKLIIAQGCTTLLMQEIGRLCHTPYPHLGKTLVRLKRFGATTC